MAIYKRDIVDINLESGNIHRTFLAHTIGYKDQKADHFGVRVFRDGEAVSLTGVSVQGVFMPPQGSPIAITSGNIVSGNTAEVVLPQACYDYNGQFCLAIKLVDSSNSVTGTVRIVDGVVDNTHASGTVAPTSAVPTYQEVLSAYEQAIAVIGSSVRFDTTQSLTTAQKTTARGNIDAASTDDVSALKSALSTITEPSTNILWFTNQEDRTGGGVSLAFEAPDIVTINGTAEYNLYLYLQGDTDKNGDKLKADTYYFGLELLSGSLTGGGTTGFAFGSSQSVFGAGVKTIQNDGAIGIRLKSGGVYSNAKYRFWIVKGDEVVPYVSHDDLIAVDDVARKGIELMGTEIEEIEETIGKDIKGVPTDTLWLSLGSYKASNGQTNTDDSYGRSNVCIPEYVNTIETTSDFVIRLFAWVKSTNVYAGMYMTDGTFKPYVSGDVFAELKKIDMDEIRKTFPTYRFQLVVLHATPSTLTLAEVRAAFKMYSIRGNVNGNIVCFDCVQGTAGHINDTSKNAFVSQWIPVEPNTLYTLHAKTIPASKTAGQKMFYPWGYRTYDSSGNMKQSVALTSDSITNRVFVQSDEAYLVVNYGCGVLANDAISLLSVSLNDFVFGDAWIEKVVFDTKANSIIHDSSVMTFAHRGVPNIAPENVAPAYILAKKLGFNIADADVMLTSDGVPVVLHDETINRTGRNPDGTVIAETIDMGDITYDQALYYDFGIYKGASFAGTKILTVEQFLQLCNEIGMIPALEIKHTITFTQEQVQSICNLVKKYGFEKKCIIDSTKHDYLVLAVEYLPYAQIGYLVNDPVDASYITNAQQLQTGTNEVQIWAKNSLQTAETIQLCINAGIPVWVWTVNDALSLCKLNPYPNGIVSDEANVSEWLYEYGQSQFAVNTKPIA